MKQNKHLVLIGMGASGKTTIGIEVSKTIGIPFVDSDDLVEREGQEPIHILNTYKNKYFCELEERVMKETLQLKQPVLFSSGANIIHRNGVAKIFKERGVVFFLKSPPEATFIRWHERAKTSDLPKWMIKQKDIEAIRKRWSETKDVYQSLANHVVDTSSRGIEGAVGDIVSIYKNEQT